MRHEANALFIVVFHSFLAGLELNLKKKCLNHARSCDFEIFKGMSHNLELLRFQKMCGLLGFIGEIKCYSNPRTDGPEGWLMR